MPEDVANVELSEVEINFWIYAFEDLHRTLERIPRSKRDDYFKKLYHQNADYRDIKEEVIKASLFGHNIIIQGLAGSGKTTLLKRYLIDDDFLNKQLFPLYVSTINENKIVGYISAFIKKMLEYIEHVKYAITNREELNPNNLVSVVDCRKAINRLLEIIAAIDIPSREFRPLIFLDDLDYAENEWKEITDLLRDFIADSNVTFVFTLRPRLERIILRDPDDRIRYLYHNTEKAIMVVPNIMEIILNRIHIIIRQDDPMGSNDDYGWQARIYNFFHSYGHKKRRETYIEYMKDLGIDGISELSLNLRFPFHDAYIDFMRKVTGSNLRRIFLIAKDTILYLRRNPSANLEDNKHGSSEINKALISKLFMKNDKASWSFLDINSQRLSNDISLYYAILHILHNEPEDEIQDSKLYSVVKKKIKSAKKHEIEEACRVLAQKEWSLIDFIRQNDDSSSSYRLNKKGLYYLEVANWPEYQEVYGHHNYAFARG